MGLSKEVCLYVGADWLKPICQSDGGERTSHLFTVVAWQNLVSHHFDIINNDTGFWQGYLFSILLTVTTVVRFLSEAMMILIELQQL